MPLLSSIKNLGFYSTIHAVYATLRDVGPRRTCTHFLSYSHYFIPYLIILRENYGTGRNSTYFFEDKNRYDYTKRSYNRSFVTKKLLPIQQEFVVRIHSLSHYLVSILYYLLNIKQSFPRNLGEKILKQILFFFHSFFFFGKIFSPF